MFTVNTIDFTVAHGVGAENQVSLAGAEKIEIDNTVGGGINVANTNNNATEVTATSAGTGDITFDENGTGLLTVKKMVAANGDIVITADDDIVTHEVTTNATNLADEDAGDISILSRDGDLTIDL